MKENIILIIRLMACVYIWAMLWNLPVIVGWMTNPIIAVNWALFGGIIGGILLFILFTTKEL